MFSSQGPNLSVPCQGGYFAKPSNPYRAILPNCSVISRQPNWCSLKASDTNTTYFAWPWRFSLQRKASEMALLLHWTWSCIKQTKVRSHCFPRPGHAAILTAGMCEAFQNTHSRSHVWLTKLESSYIASLDRPRKNSFSKRNRCMISTYVFQVWT